jgi:hypothetical protein
LQDLQNLEVFEIEILDLFNSIKVLDSLYFGGGTMLRLCHNLNRYSTDLDFWTKPAIDVKYLYPKIIDAFSDKYKIVDAANKKFTILFEISSANVNRNLKIEIRKEQVDFESEKKIAFSKFANKQVIVNGLTLQQMMLNKTEAFLSRKLIRDCFDIEFLLMRGAKLTADKMQLKKMLNMIVQFKERDYKVTLGSILEEKERKFHIESKFRFLKEEINKILAETNL